MSDFRVGDRVRAEGVVTRVPGPLSEGVVEVRFDGEVIYIAIRAAAYRARRRASLTPGGDA